MSIPKQFDSLVDYEHPIEVSSQEELERLKALGQSGGGQGKKTAEEIIRSILAPKEWDQDGKHYVSFVSPQIASREDVSHLQGKQVQLELNLLLSPLFNLNSSNSLRNDDF